MREHRDYCSVQRVSPSSLAPTSPILLLLLWTFDACDPAGTKRAELTVDLIPSSMLPKLQRMVELMLEAGYEIAQQGYIQLRDKALHQVLTHNWGPGGMQPFLVMLLMLGLSNAF